MINIDINELAKDLDLTRQNLNYHIKKGRAGKILKDGENETSKLVILPDNVLKLIIWLFSFGRGNKLSLSKAHKKYTALSQ